MSEIDLEAIKRALAPGGQKAGPSGGYLTNGYAGKWIPQLVAEVERLRTEVAEALKRLGNARSHQLELIDDCGEHENVTIPELQAEVERLREEPQPDPWVVSEYLRLKNAFAALGPIAHANQLAAQRRKELLEKVEWEGGTYVENDPYCMFCMGEKPNHEPDCELAKELNR